MRAAAAAIVLAFPTALSADEISDASQIAAEARGADIVLLGEIHDNPGHHAMQADAIAAIAPSALVFEMITASEARGITPDLAADADALQQALDWANSGWPDFTMYAPLFAFGETLPVYGAEVPREDAQLAFAHGAAAAFGDGAARFGLTTPLPEAEQAAREAAQLAAHCDALPAEILPGFVDAQRLRDAALAEVALAALQAHGAPVVVITGNGHARRDWGVPSVLQVAAPDVTVLSVGQFEATPTDPPPFDLWVVGTPVERPDPCAAFR